MWSRHGVLWSSGEAWKVTSGIALLIFRILMREINDWLIISYWGNNSQLSWHAFKNHIIWFRVIDMCVYMCVCSASRSQKEKPKLIVCSISVCCGSPKNPQWIITLNKEFVQFIAKEISIQNQNAFKHTAKTKCNLKLYIIETKNKYNKRCPSLSFGESYKIYWTRQNSASWS